MGRQRKEPIDYLVKADEIYSIAVEAVKRPFYWLVWLLDEYGLGALLLVILAVSSFVLAAAIFVSR